MRLLKLLCIPFVTAIYGFNMVNATVGNVGREDVTTVELVDSFRTSKNIMFSCMYGGSSHVIWVLTILEELSHRGHSTFYQTKSDQVKFSENYPSIKTSSIGPSFDSKRKKLVTEKLQLNFMDGYKDMLMGSTYAFKEDYIKIRDFISSNNIDLAICDSLNHACVEASLSSQIPFIVTGSVPVSEDAKAPYINNVLFSPGIPTTEHMSLKERLRSLIITPIRLAIKLRGVMHMRSQTYMTLGLSPSRNPYQRWKNSVKLINTAFGFEPARPLGPLMEFIGPIIPRTYSTLDSRTQSFLNKRSKVVYVAFGQHAVPTVSDGRLIIIALLEALESKHIDGVIWATRDTSDMLPSYVTTSSNTTYDINDFTNPEEGGSAQIMFLEWAPQMAILQHPSTTFFITHGGSGSIYESMYSGKPVIVYPFFLDQPSNAYNVEKNGIGLRLNRASSQEVANQIVARMATDENRVIQSNTDRFKAYVQIKSKRGAGRGADIIEEVMFTHKEHGEIPHRYPVSRDMSFLKANNYDIYLFLISSTLCFGYGVMVTFNYFTSPVPKTKLL